VHRDRDRDVEHLQAGEADQQAHDIVSLVAMLTSSPTLRRR
jgi:hypothetical protein